MKYSVLFILLTLISCSISSSTKKFKKYASPTNQFQQKNFELDYNLDQNWAFNPNISLTKDIYPQNYPQSTINYNIAIFYIHPTTYYNGSDWNVDTSYFRNNDLIDLCLENQASVFDGLGELYAPHYREMHIHAYTDTINGFLAFDYAYGDVLNAFNKFISEIGEKKYIVASHSQGTNHAIQLIHDRILPDHDIKKNLILSYLIGMDLNKTTLNIPECDGDTGLYCLECWRSFNRDYLPTDWKYGQDYISTNPIISNGSDGYTNKIDHMGILLPNRKIKFTSSISVNDTLGILWVDIKSKRLKRHIDNSYHKADYNLFWPNIRKTLISRLRHLDDA